MFYSNPTGCTIFFFLEKVFSSTCFGSIVSSTTAVYSHRFFFMVLVCLFHGAGTDVGTVCLSLKLTVLKWQSVPTPVPAPWNNHTKTIKKNLWLYTTVVLLMMDACDIRNMERKNFSRKKEYCTSSWIRIKRMLPRCTEPQILSLFQRNLQPHQGRLIGPDYGSWSFLRNVGAYFPRL
jgi:hypothetical protein